MSEEVASEIPDINVVRTESGKIYLLSKKDKLVPRHSQLGGFGTGTYVSTGDAGPAVKWNVTSDTSLCQIDDSTVRQDATSVTTLSLYKLLVMLEKSKRITEHRLSYIEVKRKDQSEDTLDGFDVTVRNHQKIKMVKTPAGKEEKPSGKNVFGRCIESEASAFLTVTYRWRFEKVGGNLKVQKPYVVCSKPLQLSKEKPLQAALPEGKDVFHPCSHFLTLGSFSKSKKITFKPFGLELMCNIQKLRQIQRLQKRVFEGFCPVDIGVSTSLINLTH